MVYRVHGRHHSLCSQDRLTSAVVLSRLGFVMRRQPSEAVSDVGRTSVGVEVANANEDVYIRIVGRVHRAGDFVPVVVKRTITVSLDCAR